MLTLIALFLLIIYISFIGFIFKKTFEGDAFFLLLYILLFLPFYTVFQLIVFKGINVDPLVSLIKYSKDFVFFTGFFIFLLGSRESLVEREWKFTVLDKLIGGFMLMAFVYMLLPLGEAPLVSKMVYAKNMFLMGIIYFFGRNTKIDSQRWHFVVKTILVFTVLAFVVVSLESLMGVHLHSILGYAKYNLVFNDMFPEGHFGLAWTFEHRGGVPRYASFFANPLEFSASLLLFLAVALYCFFHTNFNRNRFMYLGLLLLILLSFLFAFSRGPILAGVAVVFFTLVLEKKYQLLRTIFVFGILGVIYLFFFSSKEMQYYLLDNLNFQNTSSLGHLVEWLEGLDSMVQNPMGIGLAMSGNAGGVDQSIKIGGENQYLIYGVQLGVIGLVVYCLILFKGIKDSLKVYRSSTAHMRSMGYVAAATKFGLLIPLFTANAELYLFVALFSWFLIGVAQNFLSKAQLEQPISIF